jgi:hypothetical protein
MSAVLETTKNITSYRHDFESISDTLNKIQAKIDDVSSIATHEAKAMLSDLADIMNAAELLSQTVKSRSIR